MRRSYQVASLAVERINCFRRQIGGSVEEITQNTAARRRRFYLGLAALLLLTAAYTATILITSAHGPLGRSPQGEARAWLTGAEALFNDTAAHEPMFRAPAYLGVLVALRQAGVPAAGLANAAIIVNGIAHVLATALIALLAWRIWGSSRAALLSGAMWGFYAPAVFLAAQPGPTILALLAWLAGTATALDIVWFLPEKQNGRHTWRHMWFGPALAGVAFVLAAAFEASLWPVALCWPFFVLLLGRESKGARLVAACFGTGVMVAGIVGMQDLWGGSPQPLSGADLYRLAMAQRVTEPWAAPLPHAGLNDDTSAPDILKSEALAHYQIETQEQAQGLSVMAGYWWRRAIDAATAWPLRSVLRTTRKVYQFFSLKEYGPGYDFKRASGEIAALGMNPLGWTLLLGIGTAGLLLGRRLMEVRVTILLAMLAAIGAMVWYPSSDARMPVAAILAIGTGRFFMSPWPASVGRRIALITLVAAGMVFTWLPRPNDPGDALQTIDSEQRARALASLGSYDKALVELLNGGAIENLGSKRELAQEWRFAILTSETPGSPNSAEIERQLIDNAETADLSDAAHFRAGACLWLLGRRDGALYYWRILAQKEGSWGATARLAIANSDQETPDESRRRAAWDNGSSDTPNTSLKSFFDFLHKQGRNN